MSKDTMSQELTEMIQDKAEPKKKSERLIVRWLEEDEVEQEQGEVKHE